VRLGIRARFDPLEDDRADPHPAVRDLLPEREQDRTAHVVYAVEVADQQARVRTGREPRDAELVDAGQPGEQSPVLGLCGGRGADRLGVARQADAGLVVEDVADRGATGSAKSSAVDMKQGESRPGRPLGAGRAGVGLGQGPPLCVAGRAPSAAGPAPALWSFALTGQDSSILAATMPRVLGGVRRVCLVVGTVAAAVLALPKGARAGERWIGPSLGGRTATVAESAPVDDVFALLSDPAGGQMPAAGQIVAGQIEGVVALTAGPPLYRFDAKFHLQDLAPIGGGRYRVRATSGFLSIPTSSHPGRGSTTITTVHPVNLCVHRGDLVGFTTDGGFARHYPRGLPFRVFGAVPGAQTGMFVSAGHVGNGAVDVFRPLESTLLLMRLRLATGRSAALVCRPRARR
jgi:hypothetical protein